MNNLWNQWIYTLWSPIYDWMMEHSPMRPARERAVSMLALEAAERVLMVGVGTGQDLPLLPGGVEASGIDLSDAMLQRARQKVSRIACRSVALRQGDAQHLPYGDNEFDAAILTLILSVVPDPRRCLQETLRVLRPGGRAVVFDKFLPPGERRIRPARRLLNWLTRPFGTDINRSFEEIADGLHCQIVLDEPSSFPDPIA